MEQSAIKSHLHRLSGQIAGIEKMLEEKRDCKEIIQQLLASRASLEKICSAILQDESSRCFCEKGVKHDKIKQLEYITNNLFKIN
ncbi:MAG: metal-sensitive transcriptional regulator [Patescibacteria group bacterium]